MSCFQSGTLSWPGLPPKIWVFRNEAGSSLCLIAEAQPIPFLRDRATEARDSQSQVHSFAFGVAAHAGNEAAGFEDQVADGAVELRGGSCRRERERHAQAGAHVRDSQAARRARRRDHRHGRGRGAAGRLRLSTFARLELPRRPRRHLRLAEPDQALRAQDRRHGRRPDQEPERRRALFRPAQGQHHQFRGPREAAPQDPFRQSDAALSRRAAGDGDFGSDQERQYGPRDRHRGADRQGPARADRGAAAHRQDRDPAEHRPRGRPPTTPSATSSCC